MLRTCVYYTAKYLCLIALKLYNRLSVKGLDKIPEQRPIIIAANHTSNLDPVVIGCIFPGRLRPLAKIELFQMNPVFTWLITMLGSIPVSRESGKEAAKALRRFLELLKNGENLMIFPEGGRSRDGRVKPLEGGVAVLSTSTDAPIVPLYIAGTWEAMPMGARFIKPARITAYFGDPIMPLPKEQRGSLKEERERIRLALQNKLQQMEKEIIG